MCFSVHTHYTVQFSISTQWAKRNSQGLWKNIENAAGLEPSGEVNQAQEEDRFGGNVAGSLPYRHSAFYFTGADADTKPTLMPGASS